jgi:hypothetical protein
MSKKSEWWKKIQDSGVLHSPPISQAADLRRDLFEQRAQRPPDAIYDPTKTSDPSRPRTLMASYWRDEQVLQVTFRDGTAYNYYEVSQNEWRQLSGLRQDGQLSRAGGVASPGRMINRIFNNHPYGPA